MAFFPKLLQHKKQFDESKKKNNKMINFNFPVSFFLAEKTLEEKKNRPNQCQKCAKYSMGNLKIMFKVFQVFESKGSLNVAQP